MKRIKGPRQPRLEVVADFDEVYPDEPTCIEDLARRRLDGGFSCEGCGEASFWLLKRRRLFHCQVCHGEHRITSDTAFSRTRVGLRKWYRLIYELGIAHLGFSVAGLARDLDLKTYRTGWRMVRKVCVALRRWNARRPLLGIARFTLHREVCGGREGLCAISADGDDGGPPTPALAGLSVLPRVGRAEVEAFLKGFEAGPNGATAGDLSERLEEEGFLAGGDVEWRALYACGPEARAPDDHNRAFALRLVQIANSAVIVSQSGVSPEYLDDYMAWACCVGNRRFWNLGVPKNRLELETLGRMPQVFDDMLAACIGA